MNPVLASTLEFDTYVKEKLKASRGVPSARQSMTSQRQRQDLTDSQARLSVGGTGIASSNSRPKSAASTTQRTVNRYGGSEQQTTASDSRRKVVEPEPSPKIFEISHSWKAHIKAPDRRNPVSVPTAVHPFAPQSSSSGRTNEPWRYIPERDQRRYDSKFDDDEDFESDNNPPPPPYIDVLTESFAKELSVDAPSSIISSSTYDQHPSSQLKIRIFRLKKLFRGWRAHVQRIRPWFQRVERSIARVHQEYLLLTHFDTWRREFTAHAYFQVPFRWFDSTFATCHLSI